MNDEPEITTGGMVGLGRGCGFLSGAANAAEIPYAVALGPDDSLPAL